MGVWIAAAGAVIGAVGSMSSASKQAKGQEKAARIQAETEKELAELNFNRSSWLKQQDRKWALEDEQRQLNYKEDAVGSFRQFAPASAQGAPVPERTTIDTGNLTQFDPNQRGQYTAGLPQKNPVPGGGTLGQFRPEMPMPRQVA